MEAAQTNGFRVVVVSVKELVDGGDEIGHAVEDAAAKSVPGEIPKPPLDELQPGA